MLFLLYSKVNQLTFASWAKDSFAIPWTAVCQAPLSMDFPGKNTGVGCHFLLQGIFPTQGSSPSLLHWQVNFFTTEPPGSSIFPFTRQKIPWEIHVFIIMTGTYHHEDSHLEWFYPFKSLSPFQGPREMVLNGAHFKITLVDSSGGTMLKNLPANTGNMGSISGSGRFHRQRVVKGHAPKLLGWCSARRACVLHLLRPMSLEPVLHNRRSHLHEKLMHHNKE